MVLPIEKLKPGMEVAADVFNLNGRMMAAKGIVLSEKHLRTMKMWGIGTIDIVESKERSSGDIEESEFPLEILEAAKRRVHQRFKHVTAHTQSISIIQNIAVQRTARLMAEKSPQLRPLSLKP